MNIPSRIEQIIIKHLREYVESETETESQFYWSEFIASRRERIQVELNMASVTPTIVRIFRMLKENGCLTQITTGAQGVVYQLHLERLDREAHMSSLPPDPAQRMIREILRTRNNFRSDHGFPWLDSAYPGIIQESLPRTVSARMTPSDTRPLTSRVTVTRHIASSASSASSVPSVTITRHPPPTVPPVTENHHHGHHPRVPFVTVTRHPTPSVSNVPATRPSRHPVPAFRPATAIRSVNVPQMIEVPVTHSSRRVTNPLYQNYQRPMIPVPGPPGRRGAFLHTSADNPLFIRPASEIPLRGGVGRGAFGHPTGGAAGLSRGGQPHRAGFPRTNVRGEVNQNTSGNSTDSRSNRINEYANRQALNRNSIIALLNSLPRITSEEACTICRNYLLDRRLPCTHEVCSQCILRIASLDGRCPFCRIPFCSGGMTELELENYVWNND